MVANPFLFQASKEAFYRGVVPEISLSTHVANHTVGGEYFLMGLAGVLTAAV